MGIENTLSYCADRYGRNYDEKEDLLQQGRIYIFTNNDNVTPFKLAAHLARIAKGFHEYPMWLREIASKIKARGLKVTEDTISEISAEVNSRQMKTERAKGYVDDINNIINNSSWHMPLYIQSHDDNDHQINIDNILADPRQEKIISNIEIMDLINSWPPIQRTIALLLIQGETQKEIREKLELTERGLDKYIKKIRRKVGAFIKP